MAEFIGLVDSTAASVASTLAVVFIPGVGSVADSMAEVDSMVALARIWAVAVADFTAAAVIAKQIENLRPVGSLRCQIPGRGVLVWITGAVAANSHISAGNACGVVRDSVKAGSFTKNGQIGIKTNACGA